MPTDDSACQEWNRTMFSRCNFSGWSAKMLVLLLTNMVSLRAFNTASLRCFVLKSTASMDNTQSRKESFLAVEIVPSCFHFIKGFEIVIELSHSFFWGFHYVVWCIPLHPAKSAVEKGVLDHCFALLFGWALPPSSHISIFFTFSTLTCFPPSLRFLSPSWASSCFSTLTCYLLIFVFAS